MSEVIIIGLDIAKHVFEFTERMSGVERYSASGSVGESFWISSQPIRVAR